MEPSGQAFNARVLMSDGTGRPHNPMINAGAIMAAALIKSDRPLHRRLDYVRNMWAKMTGGSIPRFNAWMAQEESRTGDNNRALGYMMKAAGVLPMMRTPSIMSCAMPSSSISVCARWR